MAISRRKYTLEFKLETAHRVIDSGRNIDGAAGFLGSMGGQSLSASIVGMAATPDGNGYWLVGGSGAVYSY